jgi:hypothetical protein
LDEGTHQRNALRPKIREESENFYIAISLKAWETQEVRAKADNEDYYAKRLADLKKDTDARLKQEMATYSTERRASLEAPIEAETGDKLTKPERGDPPTAQVEVTPARPA